MKICKRCLTLQPLTNFHRNHTTKDGRINFCKPCSKIKSKPYKDAYYERNKQLVKDRGKSKAYKCTPEEYHERMATSKVCEICGNSTNLCYDHDHSTMEFRGVLCSNCNSGIGFLGDTLESITRAKAYLEVYYGSR